MHVTSFDGLRIAFETAGCGAPLVLLHGFFGDRSTWWSAGHVEALADLYRLVVIDARGHGASDAPHDVDSYRISRQVDDVLAVLDALGIDQAAVWGASMGGIVGLNMLACHPERVAALVVGGAHADRPATDQAEVEAEAQLLREQGTAPFIRRMERLGPLPTWMRTTMQDADPHALAALTMALDTRNGVLDTLSSSADLPPLLLLAGDRDTRLPAIRRTAAQIRGARLAELADCGHFDTFARSDLNVPVVRAFLEKVPFH
ncbi:alpha/beta fold hydrolase [Streptomyces exfoliatus]|uniref:alpha/beta fold hydrolase n=1 Tax=Streptomyces exfoliatus TaxID=1905 RepID=UPI003C2DFC73